MRIRDLPKYPVLSYPSKGHSPRSFAACQYALRQIPVSLCYESRQFVTNDFRTRIYNAVATDRNKAGLKSSPCDFKHGSVIISPFCLSIYNEEKQNLNLSNVEMK